MARYERRECDDGNDVQTDDCLNSCEIAVCGDGLIKAGVETCDDGNRENSDACLNDCSTASCGDGFVRTGVEACDDGNDVNDDGCTVECALASCGTGSSSRAGCDVEMTTIPTTA